MNKLKVYKASAGSGKTFRLVCEYLTIALKNPYCFKNILAITFTNKATEEFKKKLFYYLNGILEKSNNGDISAMKAELKKNLDKKLNLEEKANLLMNLMLHNYSEIAIMTIDSFFTKILRSFAMEMNLSFANKIVLDTSNVLDEVIDKYFNELSENTEEVDILKTFLEHKISEGKSRNIESNLKEICSELFKDRYYILSHLNSITGEYIKFLRNLIDEFRLELKTITKDIQQILNQFGLTVSDFTGGSRGFMNTIIKLSNGEIEGIDLDKWSNISDSDDWSSSEFRKQKKDISLIENAREKKLQKIVDEIYKLFSLKYQDYIISQFILENVYSVALLKKMRERIDNYQIENKVTVINEINRIIERIISDNYSSPYIYEKIGIYYHHILIDEFQDTSRIQIDNLKPLIIEILSTNGNAVIVGDEKQSIYKFRDAFPEYFIQIDNIFKNSMVEVEFINIKENFRSAPDIVNFNNEFFKKFIENETEQYIKTAFNNIEQYSVLDNKGYLEFQLLDNEKSRSQDIWKNKSYNLLYETIIKQKEKGFKYNDILILVDRNSQAEEIITNLNNIKKINGKKNNFEIVSIESLKLLNSPEVIFIINFLRYLNDFNNEVAEFDILYYLYNNKYPAYKDYKPEDFRNKEKIRYIQKFDKEFESQMVSWTRMSIQEIIMKISLKYGLFNTSGKFIFKLIDICIKSTEETGGNLTSFINYWDENKEKFSISSNENENAVEIMSIHKSKGLQRKIIIIPLCDIKFEPDGKFDYYWTKHQFKNEKEYDVFIKMTKEIFNLDAFNNSSAEERKKIRLDKINKLYVAFTRAEQKLFVFSKKSSDDKKKSVENNFSNANEVINKLIPEISNIQKESGDGKYTIGKDFKNNAEKSKPNTDNKTISGFDNILNWREKLVFEKSDYLKFSVSDGLDKTNYGTDFHKLFSKINYAEDLTPAINSLASLENLDDEQKNGMKLVAQNILSNIKIKDWFKEDSNTKIYKEKSIINKNGDEIRPDRVVIKNGIVDIIDFKSSKSKNHSEQLKKYKKYFVEMGYKKINTFIVYLNSNEVEEIV